MVVLIMMIVVRVMAMPEDGVCGGMELTKL